MQRLSKQLEFDMASGEIAGPGGRERLEPQAMAVLDALATQRDQVVSRDALLERAWDGRIVSDSTVSAVISQLRAALRRIQADDVRIATLSKRGYRLDVMQAADEGTRRQASWWRRGLLPGAIAGTLSLLFAVALWQFRPPVLPSSLDGVRLDFVITLPDGNVVEPMIWLEPGTAGRIAIGDDYPLAVNVVPHVDAARRLLLDLEVSNGNHWSSNRYITALDTENRLQLREAEGPGEYDIRFSPSLVARDELPSQ